MKKEKVLVSGLSGFIGQYLEKALIAAGYEVFGMYEHKESFRKNKYILEDNKFLVDLKDKGSLEYLVKHVQPHYVIHLAAKTEVALSFDNYSEVSEVNYVGTVNFAEANRRFNPNLKLFLMASTMETYGHQDPKKGAFTEETPQKPMAPYAVAKIACEYYLRYMAHAYDFPFCAFRQTNAYGRTDNDFFVIERIISQMLTGDVCNLGESQPVRNFIWINDLIDLYLSVLKRPALCKGETFVTGPNNPITIKDLAELIKEKTDFKGEINWRTIPKRPGEIYYLNSNPAKAKNILGWEPRISLSEGLDKTIEIWQNKVI